MSGTLAIVVTLSRSAVLQRSSKMVQAERPVLAVGDDKIEVELAQNVDRPPRWEERLWP